MNPMLMSLLGQPQAPIPMRQPWQTPGINPGARQPTVQQPTPAWGSNLTSLLGNPMFRAGVSLLGTKDKRNALNNALQGLQGASQFQQQKSLFDLEKGKLEREAGKAERTRIALEEAAMQAEAAGNPTAAALLQSEATASAGASLLGKAPPVTGTLLKDEEEQAAGLDTRGSYVRKSDGTYDVVVAPPKDKAPTGEQYKAWLAQNNPELARQLGYITDPNAISDDRIKLERQFREDYTKKVEPLREVADNHKRLLAALTTPGETGISDVTATYSFMKALDPRSVVREGEFAMAEQAAGLKNRFMQLYNKYAKGGFLPDNVKREMAQISSNMAAIAQNTASRINQEYGQIASDYGYGQSRVMPTYDWALPTYQGAQPVGSSDGVVDFNELPIE